MSEVKFEPFQKVLVRDNENQEWRANFFSNEHKCGGKYVCSGFTWNFCIPYEGNEHLLGTTDSPTPPEQEFQWGDHVEVRDYEGQPWRKAIYISKNRGGHYCMIAPNGSCCWHSCRHADW